LPIPIIKHFHILTVLVFTRIKTDRINESDILSHAVDFAVMTLGLSADAFGDAFAVSDVSKQFANGNPSYVAGINGCELA